MVYVPEVETEFNRLRDEGHLSKEGVVNGVMQGGHGTLRYEFRSTNQKSAYREREDETLFFEDYMRLMARRRRSKSLDQIHTIVLSDKIFAREQQRAMEE